MKANQFVVIVHSSRPETLIGFYEDVVGLTPAYDVTPGAFMTGSSEFVSLIIEGHSELRGATKEPQRVLLNFVVDDLAAEHDRLTGRGVEFIREPAVEPGAGVFATFLDPDGNYCQLVELA